MDPSHTVNVVNRPDDMPSSSTMTVFFTSLAVLSLIFGLCLLRSIPDDDDSEVLSPFVVLPRTPIGPDMLFVTTHAEEESLPAYSPPISPTLTREQGRREREARTTEDFFAGVVSPGVKSAGQSVGVEERGPHGGREEGRRSSVVLQSVKVVAEQAAAVGQRDTQPELPSYEDVARELGSPCSAVDIRVGVDC